MADPEVLGAVVRRFGHFDTVATWVLPDHWLAPAADRPASESDDTLILLFMCCHPALSPASQIALTLRAVGGLTTAEIARAFLVPEATMTRRISRAKQGIKDSGMPFGTEVRQGRACSAASWRPKRSGWPAWPTACCPMMARWRGCLRSCCSPTRAGRRVPGRTAG